MILVALWALAEGLIFFVVADVPISWIGLRYGKRRAMAAALVAGPMAALGGVGMASATVLAPKAMAGILPHIPGISAKLIAAAQADWQNRGFIAMLAGSFSGVPYKLYAHAAALNGMPFFELFVLSVVARLPRFLMVGFISGSLGKNWPLLRKPLAPLCFWIIFYMAYFAAMAAKY